MTALPAFAGTVTPVDLLAKLDAQRAELESRAVAAEARATAVETFLNRQTGGYGLGPVTDAGIHVYSAKAVPGWTSATRKGGFVLTGAAGGFLDADGRAAVTWLADLPAGAKRFVMASWNSSGKEATSYAVQVTVFDVAADGTATVVRTAQQGYGNFGEGNANFYGWTGAGYVVRMSDTLFKVKASYRSDSNFGTSGCWTLYTYTLNTDQNANTLSVSKEVELQAFRSTPVWTNYVNYSGYFRRKAWTVGSYGVAWPNTLPGSGTDFANRQQPGVLMGDRLPGSGYLEARPVAPASLPTWTACLERVGATTFAELTDGASIGRPTPASGARVSVVAIDDAHAGALASVAIPYGVAGNPRLAPLSATTFAVGFTNGSQFGSYLVTRDPATGLLTWRGTQDTTGVMGTVWAEATPFSATKLGLWTLAAGWTFNLTTVAVDVAALPGPQAVASPYTVGVSASVNLGALVPAAVAGDVLILGAVERIGPDRVLTIARNATRNALAVEVWDLA